MFVKVIQTRHTKIGTLRKDRILDVSELSEKGAAVIKALLDQENSPLQKMSKEEAEADKAAISSLVPKPGSDESDPDSIDLDVLERMQADLKAAKADSAAALARAETAEQALTQSAEGVAALEADLQSATERADIAEVAIADAAAEKAILETDLAAAISRAEAAETVKSEPEKPGAEKPSKEGAKK